MPIYRTSDAGIAVSIQLLKLRANFWIKVRVHQLVRIGLASVRANGFVFTPYQRKKYPELQEKSAGTKKIMFTADLGYESGRLAPRFIKTNPVKIDGQINEEVSSRCGNANSGRDVGLLSRVASPSSKNEDLAPLRTLNEKAGPL